MALWQFLTLTKRANPLRLKAVHSSQDRSLPQIWVMGLAPLDIWVQAG